MSILAPDGETLRGARDMTDRTHSGESSTRLPFVASHEKARSLARLIQGGASRRALASFLDALEKDDRILQVRALPRHDLARLYELAATDDPGPVEPSFLVPSTVPENATLEWVGLNSLPLFRRFTKRFTRSTDPGRVVGHNTGAAQGIVGPGYFTVTVRPGHPSELLMDYARLPDKAPTGWPALRPNEAGLSRWVFAGMQDVFRPLGSSAGIGAAFARDGRPRGQYFALARGAVLPLGS